jgi:hypothetical protein
MTKLLCHINDEGFTTKPTDLKFMGRLRDKIIQKPWDYITEDDFVSKVTSGYAFYGCLFNGHDLLGMVDGRQRQCWRAQSIVAVDIDKCSADPQAMCRFYFDLGLIPWLAYTTFSDDPNGLRSYRLMWKVEVDHRVSYEQWAAVIKSLSNLTEYGDKRACDPSRQWQGSQGDCIQWFIPGLSWNYEDLSSKLGLK